MCLPAGRYSGGYPGRWRGDRIPALWRWPHRRGFTRRVEAARQARLYDAIATWPWLWATGEHDAFGPPSAA